MRRRTLALLAAGMLGTVLAIGCTARREPLVLIEPSYSHLRDGPVLPRMAASDQATSRRAAQ